MDELAPKPGGAHRVEAGIPGGPCAQTGQKLIEDPLVVTPPLILGQVQCGLRPPLAEGDGRRCCGEEDDARIEDGAVGRAGQVATQVGRARPRRLVVVCLHIDAVGRRREVGSGCGQREQLCGRVMKPRDVGVGDEDVAAGKQDLADRARLQESHAVEEEGRAAKVDGGERSRVIVNGHPPRTEVAKELLVVGSHHHPPGHAEATDMVQPIVEHLRHARVAKGQPGGAIHGHVLEQDVHGRSRWGLIGQAAGLRPPLVEATLAQQSSNGVRLALHVHLVVVSAAPTVARRWNQLRERNPDRFRRLLGLAMCRWWCRSCEIDCSKLLPQWLWLRLLVLPPTPTPPQLPGILLRSCTKAIPGVRHGHAAGALRTDEHEQCGNDERKNYNCG